MQRGAQGRRLRAWPQLPCLECLLRSGSVRASSSAPASVPPTAFARAAITAYATALGSASPSTANSCASTRTASTASATRSPPLTGSPHAAPYSSPSSSPPPPHLRMGIGPALAPRETGTPTAACSSTSPSAAASSAATSTALRPSAPAPTAPTATSSSASTIRRTTASSSEAGPSAAASHMASTVGDITSVLARGGAAPTPTATGGAKVSITLVAPPRLSGSTCVFSSREHARGADNAQGYARSFSTGVAVRHADHLLHGNEFTVELGCGKADLDVQLKGSARFCAINGHLLIACKACQDAHLVFDKMSRRYNTDIFLPHCYGVVLFGHVSVAQEVREVFVQMDKHLSEILWPPPMHISVKLLLYWKHRQWPPADFRLVNCDVTMLSCWLLFSPDWVVQQPWMPPFQLQVFTEPSLNAAVNGVLPEHEPRGLGFQKVFGKLFSHCPMQFWSFSAQVVVEDPWSPFILIEIKGDAVHFRPNPWQFFCAYAVPVHLESSLSVNIMLADSTQLCLGLCPPFYLGWFAVQERQLVENQVHLASYRDGAQLWPLPCPSCYSYAACVQLNSIRVVLHEMGSLFCWPDFTHLRLPVSNSANGVLVIPAISSKCEPCALLLRQLELDSVQSEFWTDFEIGELHSDIDNSSSKYAVRSTWRVSLLGSVEMQLSCGGWKPYFRCENFCREPINPRSCTRGHVTVLLVQSRGKGFKFRMLNGDESNVGVMLDEACWTWRVGLGLGIVILLHKHAMANMASSLGSMAAVWATRNTGDVVLLQGNLSILMPISSLVASGDTIVADGFKMGAIILLSDGHYVQIHTFCLGSDHDSAVQYAISKFCSGITPIIDAEGSVHDEFAQCIGGFLSVVVKEMQLGIACVHNSVLQTSTKSGWVAVLNVPPWPPSIQPEMFDPMPLVQSKTLDKFSATMSAAWGQPAF